jgi:hypothetical protein
MIEDGEFALDLPIVLPRSRERGSAAALEGAMQRRLFRKPSPGGCVTGCIVGIVRASAHRLSTYSFCVTKSAKG